MKNILLTIIAAAFLCGCSDPEGEANKLFTEASQLVKDADAITEPYSVEAFNKRKAAIDLIEKIPAQYPQSSLSVEISKGDFKIQSQSIDQIREKMKPSIAIQYAAKQGIIKAVRLHLALGTDVNAMTPNGWAALHGASENGHKEIVELLITAGADLNIKDYKGMTPLHVGHKEKKIVELLISAGADTNVINLQGLTSLDLAHSPPSFSLAWSEYPSWSVFGVADATGIINGEKFKLGPVERKWGVDIELKEAEYDPCIAMYGAGNCDAVCITNMDVLSPSGGRPGVMVLPTSTSFGADACLVTSDIKSVEDLKGKKVFGFEKSISEYCFVRNLELLNQKEEDYLFSNMDPGAAALAMQQKNQDQEAIVVWNPFVISTLAKRDDVRVLFDSTKIPNEIIDSVVVAKESLEKEGGEAFACAIIDAFYQVNAAIADPQQRDDTLIAIGEKFANVTLKDMEKVVQQTKFYGTTDEGEALLTRSDLPKIMDRVVDFCISKGIISFKPNIGYGDGATFPEEDLRFDSSYIKKVKNSLAK